MKTAFLLSAPIVLSVLAFFILPYGAALLLGFIMGTGGSAVLFEKLLPLTAFTFKQAVLSTLAAFALGLPGALLFSSMKECLVKKLLRSLTAIPFALPPVLAALGFTLFFGNAGFLNRALMAVTGLKDAPLHILYRSEAVILAHAFYNFPIVIRFGADALSNARALYSPASASLGAPPWKTALYTLLPVTMPSFLAAALLVFLYCFTSFALVLVLGGGPAVTTLAVEIYRYARISLDYKSAGVFALTETCGALAVFAVYIGAEKKSRVSALDISALDTSAEGNQTDSQSGFISPLIKIAGCFYTVIICVLALGPLITIPIESFLSKTTRAAASGFSLRWWLELGGRGLPALGRSALLAALSATLSCVIAIPAAMALHLNSQVSKPRFIIKTIAVSPIVSSGIVLGLGFIVLYGRIRSQSIWAAAALHAVSALPFVFNSINEGFAALPKNALAAAASLGAAPFRQLTTVLLPLSLARIRSAWSFAALISLGELNAVMMLGLDWETLPLLIYRAAGSYRYGAACAAGTLLIALCCILMSVTQSAERAALRTAPRAARRT